MGPLNRFDISYDFFAFKTEVSKRYFSVETETADPVNFRAHLSTWRLGQTGITHLRSQPMRHQRASAHMGRDEGEYLLIPVSCGTEVSFHQGRNELLMKGGQFILQLSSRPYEYIQRSQGDVWTFLAPMKEVRGRIPNIDRYTSYCFDASRGVGRMFFNMMQTIPTTTAGLNDCGAAGMSGIILDLLALALESDERILGSGQSSVRKAMLSRVEQYVRANLGNPNLNAETIATAMGYSVRYLHQIFSDADISLAHWISDQRLARSRHDLENARPLETISEICFRWGFSSEAHFSRKFKSHFGLTPSECKRSVRPQQALC